MIYKAIKRVFDFVCAFLGIVGTSPIWILSMVLTELSDPGPLFYFANRVGKDNKKFKMWKFRSMRVARGANEASLRPDQDRIFWWGKIMRRLKIDELPQLMNILNGTMSIVGPRPAAVDQVDITRGGENAIAATVPCGLTSQSSLWDYIYGDQFPDEKEYNEKVLPIRLKLDVYYVKNASFFGDIKLIVWTVIAILYTACGKYPQWMHDKLVGYVEKKSTNMNPVDKCCQQLSQLVDNSCGKLHDSIRNFLFQGIDYDVINMAPLWVADCGINPEDSCSKDTYEKFRKSATHPVFGRLIYYYDLWSKISAIQDRLQAVINFLRHFYTIVPCVSRYEEEQYTNAAVSSGECETNAYVFLNSIFVAYASVFDLLAKVATEQYKYDDYNFSEYKKMMSAGVLFRKSLKEIDSSLKKEGMLFAEPAVIRKIETFRNEYVHNGAWGLRCSVYNTVVNGEPGDVVFYSPDMDDNGNFVTSGSRNKFYSQGNRINIQLPEMIMETTKIVDATINQLCALYQNNTTQGVDEQYTLECQAAISKYRQLLVEDLKKK